MKTKSNRRQAKSSLSRRGGEESSSSSSSEPSPALNPMPYDLADSDSDAFSVNALRDTIVSTLKPSSSSRLQAKSSTFTYPRHASASRQRPPNPPDTANRSLARKVEEVKAQLQRERNRSEHLQSLLDQGTSVSTDNKKLRLQIKELQVRARPPKRLPTSAI